MIVALVAGRGILLLRKKGQSFQDVPRGGTAESVTGFSILQDRRVPFDPDALLFTFERAEQIAHALLRVACAHQGNPQVVLHGPRRP